MSKIEFKNHIEEFARSSSLCDVIEVDGQLYVHISKVEVFQNQLQQKENIIKDVREDLHQVVKWCTENKHNENTIERYLVVDYGTLVGKINEIRTKLDKEVN